MKNASDEEVKEQAKETAQALKKFEEEMNQIDRTTMTDLQTYMIVKERTLEVAKILQNKENDSTDVAYAIERLESARSWSAFFGTGVGAIELDETALRESCLSKLGEVTERYQYLSLFFPDILDEIHNHLVSAYDYYTNGNYELCLFKASQTKAEADVLAGVIGVKPQTLDHLLAEKLAAARKQIPKQIEKGVFPILAYSYYEYATTLAENGDKTAALIYAEYALEMSDLDIYFKSSEKTPYDHLVFFIKSYREFLLIFLGALFGACVYGVLARRSLKTERYTFHKLPQQKKRKKIKLRS